DRHARSGDRDPHALPAAGRGRLGRRAARPIRIDPGARPAPPIARSVGVAFHGAAVGVSGIEDYYAYLCRVSILAGGGMVMNVHSLMIEAKQRKARPRYRSCNI